MRLSVSDLAALNQEQLDERNRERLLELGGAPALAMGLIDAARGLTAHQVSAQRAEYGTNDGRRRRPPSPGRPSWTASTTPRYRAHRQRGRVAAVGIYDDLQKGWIEGAAILVAVAIVAVVTATNDFSKEQQFQALNAVKDDIEVKQRDGAQVELNVKDVVVGDVLRLEAGDKISADAVYSSGLECVCNESSLTGEPAGVLKSVRCRAPPSRAAARWPPALRGAGDRGRPREPLGPHQGRPGGGGGGHAAAGEAGGDGEHHRPLRRRDGAAHRRRLLAASRLPGADVAGAEQLPEAFIIAVTIVVVAVPEGLLSR